jgi:hypothetical protein
MQVQLLGMEPAIPPAQSLIAQLNQPKLEVLQHIAQISLLLDNSR